MKNLYPIALMASLVWITAAIAGEPTSDRATFATAEEALSKLRGACALCDREALRKLFGPAASKLASGDEAQDAEDLKIFAARLKASADLQPDGENRMVVYVGAERFPFPVPIVCGANGKWHFDTESGLEEILNRRIGENEICVMQVCQGYLQAQREYALQDWDGDGVMEYAQLLRSSPGKRDGLYWESQDDDAQSPLGALVAEATLKRHDAQELTNSTGTSATPYHGYLYKIITNQASSAPGGEFDYVINGNMVAGFAVLAVPVEWGSSGIMTFMVNANGIVYEKNLGKDTAKIAAGIDSYAIDDSWKQAVAND